MFVCEYNSNGYGDGYGVEPPQTPSVFSITNLYLSVNTIQMEMEMDTE